MTPTATTSTSAPAEAPVDLYEQALKCLAERSPFDTEEFLSRVPTLPFGISSHFFKNSDVRKKFKKPSTHGEATPNVLPQASKQSSGSNMWEEMEEYFRPITEEDIKLLRAEGLPDSCFSVPVVDNSAREVKKDVSFSESIVGPSSELVKEEREQEQEKSEQAEVTVREEAQPMEIDSVGNFCASTSALLIQEEEEATEVATKEEEDDSSSVNWLLGSKYRVILTTQRPTKKRKLLGSDAGLDQLVALPHPQESSAAVCDVCCLGESGRKSKGFISCSSCSVLVHKKCYGVCGTVEKPWLCSWCKHLEGMREEKEGERVVSRPCVLCPKDGGALKVVGGDYKSDGVNKFAHLFCSLWTPEVYVEDTRAMEPVVNVGGVPEMRTRLVCNVCKVKHGVCVRCSYGTCRTAFHPICAREARHQMEIWGKFGCDNVELRSLCSKHSTSQGVESNQITRNLSRSTDDDSAPAKALGEIPPPNKLPKLKFTSKSKDKNMTQMAGELLNEVATDEEYHEKMGIKPSLKDSAIQSNTNMNVGVIDNENSSPHLSNLVPFIKKLIARGKIILGDVASELGVSSDSLEAALMGEYSSFPSELGLKIAKWFQESIYLPASVQQLKSRNGSAISSGSLAARVDCPNAAYVQRLDIPGGAKVADPDNADDSSSKSLPPGITDSNVHTTVCSDGDKIQQSSNGEVLPGHTFVAKEDATRNTSSGHGQQYCYKDELLSQMITSDTIPDSNPLQVLAPQVEGAGATVKGEMSQMHQPESSVENGQSRELDNSQVEEANTCSYDAVNRKRISGSCSGFYVPPLIQKWLVQVEEDVLLKQESRESITDGTGHSESIDVSTKTSDLCNYSLPPTRTEVEDMLNVKLLDQLARAKQMGILELSPEDELEGEILYLQNKLLDNSVTIKHSFEDLMGKVVQKLPLELETLKKQRWDLVLVNQFLNELREDKKRGRKERKHREAQAVLAAAAAAAATSSRNSLLRKDGADEISSLHQESPTKVSGLPGRASGHSPLGPRLKETQRSTFVKVSSDKHSGTPEFSIENALYCDICRRSETLLNRIFVCSSCKVPVHLECYRNIKDPIGPWKCELCEEMSQSHLATQCGLCGGGTGAFRKATNGHWVHAFCAEWLLELTFRRGQQNLVDGMDKISKEKGILNCCLCHQNFGVCTKCSYGHCQATFHPYCARIAGFFMNVKSIGGRFHHKTYCEKHSVEQRQKADNQQYGAEDLKNIKQIRFELERVRLLCERIIKREKVKRDLLLCSHDILSSRMNCVAYNMLVRGSFLPGASSESATTSLDNKSFGGPFQRSEEMPVDSTVSGKRTIRLSSDMDQRSDDRSSPQLSLKRKTSCSGKQLPHRTASGPLRSLADDGEKRSKAKKHAETFHKEVVMTSHQASMQNQRLPKGFAYVPVDYLSRGKPVLHNSESHEPEEPGG